MSILKAHVTAMTCDSSVMRIKTPFREILQRSNCSASNCDRMACRPEDFAKAGFFFSCRTPHVSKGQCLGLRGRKQGALSEGRRGQSVCEELARTGKWFDEGLAHHKGSRKKNRIATRNVVLRDGVKAGSNLLALPIV
jgi:hypothetical protein